MAHPPPLPTAPQQPAHPFDFHNMPVQEAYRHLNAYQRSMTPEQLMAAKMEIMRPYRKRNMIVGGILLGGTLAIFGYSMYKTGRDDFDNIPMPPPSSADKSA
ncbi:uncharacterized protein SPPG_08911 [Spizellomyces punctatus DAOM BR117]|uniref:Cytochrome c oxidase assembly factor 3 mitochondrial coiled-coil domain-containing protein n=1 Tax=Spizellomyces punctatus (strain DAOM BR117) TaxID=645134 RepID=A0A0L0HRK1_SPIPD|nr:uncharacterized protein SPPG_08911 [Spizellomyces punctatus DAOM BR117]KND03708.1 hypothetical protein SPPG_08911 [Spizellomyces punctatus DAOM BR117]|eukprot:XP_016611747.1 hypothetical protein SPPG_08911 [Spizellomyces punctatus DAOM BR117]